MRVRYSSRAIAELEAILSDMATKHPSAAKRFLARMRQVGERIGRFPEGFQEVARRPGVRRVPLVRYPYLVFYQVVAGEAVILSLVHGARKEPWENL